MKYLQRPILHTLFGFTGVLACYIGFLAFTNPYKLPIAMLVIPSVMLGLVLYLLVRLMQKLHILKPNKLTVVLLPIYGVLISLLASLHQLSWRDAILAAALLWLFSFYFSRTRN